MSITKDEFKEYIVEIGLVFGAITASDDEDVRLEGAEIIISGLREMYDKIEEKHKNMFLEYVKLSIIALSIIVASNDSKIRSKGAYAIIMGLKEVYEKVF